MNELQKVEFNILKEFIKVCETLNIEYFLVCGSALGAVKYSGFIPWDDDIDVALYREDYELFCQEAQKLLPTRYFLQTYKTDKYYPNIHCKIRDSKTTYIEKSVKKIDMNHGIYIDVFPLDGYPQNNRQAKKLEWKKKIFKFKLSCAVERKKNECSKKAYLFFGIGRLLGFHKSTQQTLKKYEEVISAYDIKSSSVVCNHGNWQGELEYAPKFQYGKGTCAMFEGLKVRIPEKYDEYLTQKYDDWRAELPKEEQRGHHYHEICDVNRPYSNYTK